jgi:RNA polymerase subunit RPABC4/transcription elongation factor Spt4
MTENISNLIVAVAAIFGAIAAALIGGLTMWTFRDIRSRSRDILVQILATVMVGVIPIAGILVYFMLRPRETLQEGYVRSLEEESLLSSIEHQEFCPTCGRRVDQDMQWCPSCHTKLRNACGSCGKAVHLSWDMCPYCGTTQTPEMPGSTTRVSKPNPVRVSAPAQPRVAAAAQGSKLNAPAIGGRLPSASDAKARLSSLLDKVGGAIDQVASRGQQQTLPDDEDERPLPPQNGNGNGSGYVRPRRPLPPQRDNDLE